MYQLLHPITYLVLFILGIILYLVYLNFKKQSKIQYNNKRYMKMYDLFCRHNNSYVFWNTMYISMFVATILVYPQLAFVFSMIASIILCLVSIESYNKYDPTKPWHYTTLILYIVVVITGIVIFLIFVYENTYVRFNRWLNKH